MHRPLAKTVAPTQPLHRLKPERFETVAVLKALAGANRQLAELKGVSASIPNQKILIATLGLQEAKDSSAIENIVTTHDELFRDAIMPESGASPAVKEVLRYRQALGVGFEAVQTTGLLDVPVLYLSRYIIRTKSEYYRLLQSVRENDAWEEWVTYMLTAVAESARDGIRTVASIKNLLLDYKHRIREELPKIYSQDLINNIFSHPYTKIQFVEDDLGLSRLTATKYLDKLAESGFLVKEKAGRSSFYLNMALYNILTAPGMQGPG